MYMYMFTYTVHVQTNNKTKHNGKRQHKGKIKNYSQGKEKKNEQCNLIGNRKI